MLLRYCLSNFEMDPAAPIITGIIILGGGGEGTSIHPAR